MKQLNANLRDDLSDLSDNNPTRSVTPHNGDTPDVELDKDALEFERMLDCMRLDLGNLEEDLILDNEEEEEIEAKEKEKHETAVITPNMVEKAKEKRELKEKK